MPAARQATQKRHYSNVIPHLSQNTFKHFSKVLLKHNTKMVCLTLWRMTSFLQPITHDLGLKTSTCECGKLDIVSVPGLMNITITNDYINTALIWNTVFFWTTQVFWLRCQTKGLPYIGTNRDQSTPQQQKQGGCVFSGLIIEACRKQNRHFSQREKQ
jgi:hypothetical protein